MDQETAREFMVPKVIEIFAKEMGWSQERRDKEYKEAFDGVQNQQ